MTTQKENLIYFLTKTQKELLKSLPYLLSSQGYNAVVTDKYVAGIKYTDGQYPLIVAHLDTINTHHGSNILSTDIIYDENSNRLCVAPWASPEIVCLGADDRAGVTIINELLNQKVQANVLFTTDEEIGCKGAEYIVGTNGLQELIDCTSCLIQIDRGNHEGSYHECVFYQYDYETNPEFLSPLAEYFDLANGSYTDVALLGSYFNKPIVNVSAGYKNEHTRQEYVDLNVVDYVIESLFNIIHKYTQMDTTNWEYVDIYDLDYLNDWDESWSDYSELDELVDMCLAVCVASYEEIEEFITGLLETNTFLFVYNTLLYCIENQYLFGDIKELKEYFED